MRLRTTAALLALALGACLLGLAGCGGNGRYQMAPMADRGVLVMDTRTGEMWVTADGGWYSSAYPDRVKIKWTWVAKSFPPPAPASAGE